MADPGKDTDTPRSNPGIEVIDAEWNYSATCSLLQSSNRSPSGSSFQLRSTRSVSMILRDGLAMAALPWNSSTSKLSNALS